MAFTSKPMVPQLSTDALFQQFVQGVHDAFLEMGWTKTSDTGQLASPIVALAPAVGVSAGYHVWAMADSLQASAPVYVRTDYSRQTGGGNYWSLWWQVGTGTNGAGVLTGQV